MSYLLSERHFRRNEEYVKRIVDQFPAVVIFDLSPPISQTDVLARNIRHAGRSLILSQWQPTTVNLAKFFQVWDDIVISPTVNPGKVTCGPESSIRFAAGVAIQPLENTPTQSMPTINLVNPNDDLVHAIIVMHHYRYLTEPSIIQSDLDVREFTEGYDVAISLGDNNTYTII